VVKHNTENAIQGAHEDNFSAKAVSVLLHREKDKGQQLHAELPLQISLQDVRQYVSTHASGCPTVQPLDPVGEGGGPQAAAGNDNVGAVQAASPTAGPKKTRYRKKRPVKPKIDEPDNDEDTRLLGKRTALLASNSKPVDVHNAVGFFLYTQCRNNTLGHWPETLGATPHPRATLPTPGRGTLVRLSCR